MSSHNLEFPAEGITGPEHCLQLEDYARAAASTFAATDAPFATVRRMLQVKDADSSLRIRNNSNDGWLTLLPNVDVQYGGLQQAFQTVYAPLRPKYQAVLSYADTLTDVGTFAVPNAVWADFSSALSPSSVNSNLGGHWDTVSKQYTVPVSGIYDVFVFYYLAHAGGGVGSLTAFSMSATTDTTSKYRLAERSYNVGRQGISGNRSLFLPAGTVLKPHIYIAGTTSSTIARAEFSIQYSSCN